MFYTLHYMWMMSDYHRGSSIDERMCKPSMCGQGKLLIFITPVTEHTDLITLFPQLPDGSQYKVSVQWSNTCPMPRAEIASIKRDALEINAFLFCISTAVVASDNSMPAPQ
jgi:hypothetical protein